jgi:hypothetical protein
LKLEVEYCHILNVTRRLPAVNTPKPMQVSFSPTLNSSARCYVN